MTKVYELREILELLCLVMIPCITVWVYSLCNRILRLEEKCDIIYIVDKIRMDKIRKKRQSL